MNITIYRLRPVGQNQWDIDSEAEVARVSGSMADLQIQCSDPILHRLVRRVFSEPALRKVGQDGLESCPPGSQQARDAYREELFALGLGLQGDL